MPSLIVWLLACGGGPTPSPVRATLTGDQVFVGEVRTRELQLESALGNLAIPLEHVGEVVPVEGAHLAASNQYVTVWLRNGSELRGRWADPKLRMDVIVAKQPVSVELPMADLVRIQTPGDLAWPDAVIFRVETTHGDDLLVDAGKTTVTIANALGTFSPTLAECASLEPLGDPEGDWRVTLQTGTVLVGSTSPSGTWRRVLDGGAGADWNGIFFNTELEGSVPATTGLLMEARASDDLLNWTSYAAFSSGDDLGLTGKYLEVRATLSRTGGSTLTPVLSDLRLDFTPGNTTPEPGSLALVGLALAAAAGLRPRGR